MERKEFLKELNRNRKLFDKEIRKFFLQKQTDSKISPATKQQFRMIEKFILSGGKRLRPAVLMNVYKGLGGDRNILREALSVEFFHNATLIVDDVMDEDEFRRNKPTIYRQLRDEYFRKYRETMYKGSLFTKDSTKMVVSESILLSNMLYTFGGECLSGSRQFEYSQVGRMLEIYRDSFYVVNEGQMLDLQLEKKQDATEKDYLEMAKKKTAYLLKACGEVGAVMANASRQQINALSKYAMDITLAFQIHDDLMDIDVKSRKGHYIGSDIKQGKGTLVMIKALELAGSRDRKKLLKTWGKMSASDNEIDATIDILHECAAVDYCRELCKNKVELGKKWLLKAGLLKEQEEFFLGLADFVIERDI